MAFDWSKLNIISRLDARARIFVLIFAVVATIVLIYVLVRIFFGTGAATTGAAVANAPQGLTAIPGGTTTPVYSQSLEQARNIQARQAEVSGTSAIPTLINTGMPAGSANCTVVCPDTESATVNTALDRWVQEGSVSPEVSQSLEALAAKNVPVEEFAAELDRLVKEGKLTPEQARQLLEQYKKQHANALAAQSAKDLDPLIQSGDLPIDAANRLIDLQKRGATAAEYAAELDRLVREGKISPATAARLLGQFTQQCIQQSIQKNNLLITKMQTSGEITAQVASELTGLSKNNVAVNAYSEALKKNISGGKLTPAAASKLIETYTKFKNACGGDAVMKQLIEQAEAEAYKELSDLLATNKITKDIAGLLGNLIKTNVPYQDFEKTVNGLVQQGKLNGDIAKLKLADYRKVKSLRDQAQRLANLQANNASSSEYAEELKRAVQAGIITPDEATRLLQEYQAANLRTTATAAGATEAQRALAALQAGVQEGAAKTATTSTTQFSAAQTEAAAETAQERQSRIQGILNAMNGQAGQLVSAWQPPVMQERVGSYQPPKAEGVTTTTTTTTSASGGKNGVISDEPVMIKGGTVLFAVLDTAINSDYPNSPIMATVVSGKWKGAKLLGKIVTTKGVSGQMDRVSLNFTLMDTEAWPKTKTVNAFAIDPDTARTVMASSVDYHYLQRFGAMFATSFLQGYATAIMTSGSTQTTGIFGTSSVHPQLSPSQKIAVGLGQVGQSLGQATSNYINRPPTVRVDSGVGLGILFMSDVTS